MGEKRGQLDFDIDGAVIKVTDFALRERWAARLSFPAGRRRINTRRR